VVTPRRRLVTRNRLVVAVGVGILLLAVWFYEFGPSPASTATIVLGGKVIEIRYAAPSVRGRQIFGDGGLLSKDPTYPIWRAGANAATTLVTAGDVEVGGLNVPAGTYTLYILVRDPDRWQLIVNRETGQWGRSYDASRDLGRVTMAMSRPPVHVETLRYVMTDSGAGKGELRLEWEDRVATVPLAVR